MATFSYKGHTYDLYIRPWKKKNKGRYEALKWITGLKCTWERISVKYWRRQGLEVLLPMSAQKFN